MRFCAGMAVALSASVLTACGTDDADGDMSASTGFGLGATTGAANALAPTVPPDGGAQTLSTTGGAAATTSAPGIGPTGAPVVSAWVAMKVDTFVSNWNAHADLKCACYALFGFASVQACLAEEPIIEEEAVECAKRALSQDVAGADQFFDCALPAAESHTQCLQETFQCQGSNASDTFDWCESPYEVAHAGCLERSTAAREKLSSCGLFQ